MLYVTTRSNRDAYTAQRILSEKRGSDGGLYIPFRDPHFSDEEIDRFAEMSFSNCVAELLNLQFNTHLTSWDVDFAVGRYPVRLKKLSQRIVVGECWHNTQWRFLRMADNLARQIAQDSTDPIKGDWAQIGVRIAVLFGIYGELKRADLAGREKPFDVSAVSGDFTAPISAWYARRWGLPIGNIVCCCNENSEIWNLFCHGQLRTDGVAVKTATPDADIVIPESLERLICAVGGVEAVQSFLHCVRRGKTYYTEEPFLKALRQGMYVTVVGQPRMYATIHNVYATSEYILSPYDALAYAGLLDYRSQTGTGRCALLISEKAPVCDLETVADALNTTQDQLKSYIDKQ